MEHEIFSMDEQSLRELIALRKSMVESLDQAIEQYIEEFANVHPIDKYNQQLIDMNYHKFIVNSEMMMAQDALERLEDSKNKENKQLKNKQ